MVNSLPAFSCFLEKEIQEFSRVNLVSVIKSRLPLPPVNTFCKAPYKGTPIVIRVESYYLERVGVKGTVNLTKAKGMKLSTLTGIKSNQRLLVMAQIKTYGTFSI